jgi:hypothetical protein
MHYPGCGHMRGVPKVYLLWFVGAVVCLIAGVLACDLNPHPLPPFEPGVTGAGTPSNGAEDAASSNGSSGGLSFGGSSSSGATTPREDAGIPEIASEAGAAHDANLEPTDGAAAETSGDGGVASPSDAPADAPPDGMGEADAANSTEGGE